MDHPEMDNLIENDLREHPFNARFFFLKAILRENSTD
jgi:hypothetical protein